MSIRDKIDHLLAHHHSYESEFRHAVFEVLNDVINGESDLTEAQMASFFERMIEPDRTIRFKVEWFDDQNVLHVNRGYRVQFNNDLGPYKGGLRFHPTVNLSILKFLGFEQIFKNALTGFPMGGAKGGSDFDPKGKSPHEVRRFCDSFMSELYKHIGADIDIPAGDIGVGEREIGYLYGHYLKLTNRYTGVLTGKHPSFGGSCGRVEATGYGAAMILKHATEYHHQDLKKMRVLISGSGNVALHAAEKLIDYGATVLSISDSGGTLYFKEGIKESDLTELKDLKFKLRGRLRDFHGTRSTYLEGEKPWALEGDVAMPCATQDELNGIDALKLIDNGVQVFCEGANMPLTPEALEVVAGRGIIFLPGKAANAGGVAVSNLERSQNATHRTASFAEALTRLEEVMEKIHQNCLKYVDRVDGVIPYKMGANLYSFHKLYETSKFLRG